MGDPRGTPIRILIVDDHPVVVAGLASMLQTQPGIEVVGSASSGEEALELLRTTPVDIVLLDLRMPGLNGIESLLAMRRNKITSRAIILTSFETDEDIYRAVQAGGAGLSIERCAADRSN
jgi:two-component system, NarL family, response regulator